MSDKKITELPLASSISTSDVSVLVSNGNDYQFAFSSLLQLIGSSVSVGANISFGTTLPQNITGKNGDVFINTSNATFAQKISGAWAIVYTLPASGSTTDGTVLYGIGVPNSSTGNNNDTYINTGTGVFYKKTAGTWNQVFSMQTGPAGAPGAPGVNGTNGTNGFSILNGSTNPSNLSTGVNGDFYINTTTYTLFGPKTAGVWGTGISLIGDGIPIGGTSGQVISKVSNDNFDIEWSDRFAGLDDDIITDALGFTPEDSSNKGVANGYASLDGTGKVPSSQLPSYVDDVIEVVNFSSLPVTGEAGKIYITLDTNYEYRWSGSTYIRLVASPGSTDALAEGSTNLYFTFDRARSASSATSPIFYNTATGIISSQPATSSQHGYLSSTDWSTFNSKQNTITLTTTGSTGVATLVGSTLNIPNYSSSISGTQNYVSKFGSGGTSIGDSQIFDNGIMVGIGYTTDPTSGNRFALNGTAHIQGSIVVKGMSYLDGSAQIRKTTTTTNTQFGFYMINAGGTAPGLGQAAGVLAESGNPWYGSTELVFKVNPGPDVTANAAVEIMRLNKNQRILMGSATDLAVSGVKLQVTGGILSTTLTASQPVFTDANKQLVSVSVVPAANGGAGTINGMLKANGSGTVSAAIGGTDYVVPSGLSSYVLKAGDTMTGGLTAPAFISSGSSTGAIGFTASNANASGYSTISIINTGTGGKSFDIGLGGNTSASPNNFYVYNSITGTFSLTLDQSHNLSVAGGFYGAGTGLTGTASGLTAGAVTMSSFAGGGNYNLLFNNSGSASYNSSIYVTPSTGNITATGFNGPLNGNASTVTNGVYTNTPQTISGSKTFTSATYFSDNIQANNIIIQDGYYAYFRSGVSNGGQLKPGTLTNNWVWTLPDATGTIALTNGTGATGTWGISISGNAATATFATSATNASNAGQWGGWTQDYASPNSTVPAYVIGYSGSGTQQKFYDATALKSYLGLGSNAYTSTAYLPKSAGSGQQLTGDLYITKTTPSIVLSSSSYNWTIAATILGSGGLPRDAMRFTPSYSYSAEGCYHELSSDGHIMSGIFPGLTFLDTYAFAGTKTWRIVNNLGSLQVLNVTDSTSPWSLSNTGMVLNTQLTVNTGNLNVTGGSISASSSITGGALIVGSTTIGTSSAFFATSVVLDSILVLKNYTVATLPASPSLGSMAYVTNGGTNTNGVTINGGGTAKIPVFYDGISWKSLFNTGG